MDNLTGAHLGREKLHLQANELDYAFDDEPNFPLWLDISLFLLTSLQWMSTIM
jgi:hypothetical protein